MTGLVMIRTIDSQAHLPKQALHHSAVLQDHLAARGDRYLRKRYHPRSYLDNSLAAVLEDLAAVMEVEDLAAVLGALAAVMEALALGEV